MPKFFLIWGKFHAYLYYSFHRWFIPTVNLWLLACSIACLIACSMTCLATWSMICLLDDLSAHLINRVFASMCNSHLTITFNIMSTTRETRVGARKSIHVNVLLQLYESLSSEYIVFTFSLKPYFWISNSKIFTRRKLFLTALKWHISHSSYNILKINLCNFLDTFISCLTLQQLIYCAT